MAQTSSPTPRVAIIGAGPAGCAAALALGQQQFAVDLFERGLPGKDKPCGDAYSPAAIQFLTRYGITLDEIMMLGGYPVAATDLYHQDTRLWRFGSASWVVPRARLDQRCRDLAAHTATIHYGTTITAVTIASDGGFRVTTRPHDADIAQACYAAVILANGSGSLLARQWDITGQPVLGASISTYAFGSVPTSLQFHVASAYAPGYAWVFPANIGRVNLGVCALAPCSGQQLRARANAFAAAWQVTACDGWRGGGEAYWSGMGTTWHHPAGLVSCGDAAGLIDPSSGEGITEALHSGEEAGNAIARYLHQPGDAHTLVAYSQWVRDYCTAHFGPTPERLIWDSLCGRHADA